MADNVVLNAMMGGQTISTEDIGGGLEMPRTKICIGIFGSDDGDVSATSPFPCSIQNSPTVIIGSGTISLPSGAATAANQTTGNSSLASIVSLLGGTLTVSGAVTTSGTVAVSNFPASQTITGSVSVSNLPTTQPVNGTVSAALIGTPTFSLASGSTISAALTGTSSVALTSAIPTGSNTIGSVLVANLPTTQPVNGTVSAALIGSPTVSLAGGSTISAALTGTPAVALQAGSTISAALTGTSSVALTNAIPAGTNNIGNVGLLSGASVGLSAGTNNIGTVSLASGSITATLASGSTVTLGSGGNLIGSVNIPAATTVTSSVPVQAIWQGASDGANLQGLRAPTVFKWQGTDGRSSGASGSLTVWTPASGKKFRLLSYMIEITSGSYTSSGLIDVFFEDGSTSIIPRHWIGCPTASVASTLSNYNTGWITLGGSGYLSKTANNVLSLNLNGTYNAALSINVCGTEE